MKLIIIDERLMQVAKLKSKNMVDNNYFSHISQLYGSVPDMLKNIFNYKFDGYYLVIDFSKPERNVYFLKAVDEIDLLDLAGVNEIIYNPTETTEITSELSSEETSEDELKKEEISTNKNKLDILL